MRSPEWNGSERRQSQRWNLKVLLRVFQAGTDVILGHVVDVSLHGMRVVGHQRLDGEHPLRLDLDLPEEGGEWKKASVTAVVVHSQSDPEHGEYSTGFKFIEIEPETLFRLQGLIDELVPFS